MINYSIIIPHYNSVELLQRCLDSIPQRKDLEIIVVDDASSTEYVDFHFFPGKDRSDVHVIFSTQNGGGGKSRNIGLKKARGRWILFADCDDYFTENLVHVLDKYANDQHYDIVYLNSQIDKDGLIELHKFNTYIENYLNKRIYAEKVLRYGMFTPWSRMVKLELIKKHNLLFEEIRVGNDAMFCLNCSKVATRITAVSTIVYSYCKFSRGSYCTQNRSKVNNIDSRIELGLRMNKLYGSVNYLFKESFIENYLLASDSIYRKEYRKSCIKKNVNFVACVYNFVICCFGRLLRII